MTATEWTAAKFLSLSLFCDSAVHGSHIGDRLSKSKFLFLCYVVPQVQRTGLRPPLTRQAPLITKWQELIHFLFPFLVLQTRANTTMKWWATLSLEATRKRKEKWCTCPCPSSFSFPFGLTPHTTMNKIQELIGWDRKRKREKEGMMSLSFNNFFFLYSWLRTRGTRPFHGGFISSPETQEKEIQRNYILVLLSFLFPYGLIIPKHTKIGT